MHMWFHAQLKQKNLLQTCIGVLLKKHSEWNYQFWLNVLIGHQCKVKLLFPFGPHLISIDEESQLFVFDIKAESQIIHIEFDKKIFDITTVCHPMTYKDKILLGSSQVNFFNIFKKIIEATTTVF